MPKDFTQNLHKRQIKIQIQTMTKDLSNTYEGLDALQDEVAGDVAWQVLAKLSD